MKLFYLTVAVFLAFDSLAQIPTQQKKEHQRVKAGFGVTVVQTQPEYPGGQDSLESYLKKNMIYPLHSKLDGIQGRVYVGFLIDKNGKIKNSRILSGVNEELNNEALRLVGTFPDWKPGTRSGNAVDVQYILPLDFILPPKQEKP